MKKTLMILVALLLLSPCAFAGDVINLDPAWVIYTVTPRYFDANPNDGVFDKGTWQNPYVIKDQRGREVGTMKPKYLDIEPNDGHFDAGTWQNPYVIETD